MDAKSIGLGVKDIVLGVVGAVAGGYGGAPAAEGVNKASTAIDKLVEAGTEKKEKPVSRAEKFDRADFAARPAPAPVAAPPAAPGPSQDEIAAIAYLTSLGYSPTQVERVRKGPKESTLAEILPPVVEGRRVPLVDGSRVPTVEGKRVPNEDPYDYTTVDGDTLRKIASTQLGGSNYWNWLLPDNQHLRVTDPDQPLKAGLIVRIPERAYAGPPEPTAAEQALIDQRAAELDVRIKKLTPDQQRKYADGEKRLRALGIYSEQKIYEANLATLDKLERGEEPEKPTRPPEK